MASKNYKIQFSGLSIGEHHFDFKVNDKFFESLDYSEIKKANIDVNVTLLKQSTMMILDFNINGVVEVICDRCTDDFNLPISGKYKLIVKTTAVQTDEDINEDIISLSSNEHELELSHYIYEYIVLSMPIKRVHPDDANGKSTCNQEMIKKLNNYIANPDNKEEKSETDPRWMGLKNIRLN